MQKIISRFVMLLVAIVACGMLAQAEVLTPTKGVVRIKLQREAAIGVGSTPRVASKGVLSTGVHTLDISAKRIKATSIRRVFPYAPQFESQMAEYGLDRWYEVTFDESIDPVEARTIFNRTAGVQIATTKIPMVFKEGSGAFRTVTAFSVTERTSEMPFNDPRLSSQWHYHNTGTLSGSRTGADINLFEAWKTTTGKNDVTVAIIDGGIDYTHEDLAGNVLINEAEKNGKTGVDDDGNGYVDDVYGWNFCTGMNDVYPHDHGTHVAGTVAAVNNNGKGVCGIAGGDGTSGSGVKMLSAQVFDSRQGAKEGDFAAAIVYAANCGASIANCSWGWSSEDYYEQDVMDAIDYFVSMTRSNKLTGGVMFFATGNDGVTGNFYPACYEKVVSVGSMSNDFTIAPYSNYGSWVDIVAPGGNLDYGDAGGVLSTLPGDNYGFSEGTSMATPHVTGIAALVLSQYGNSDMPAETLRQQILTSVSDVYEYNAGKEGLHGAGYIDAAKALQMNTTGEAPGTVSSFTALPAQDNITLEWVIPESSGGSVYHHMVYYSTEAFTADSDLSTLKSAAVDTKFASSGDTFSYELGGLSPLTTYYIAIKAVDRWGNASALSPVLSATTNAGPRMSVDKSNLSFTVNAGTSLTGSTTFNISNLDEGLLKWSAYTRTTQSTISTYSTGNVSPGLVTNYSGKIGIQPCSVNEVYNASDFQAGEYPKEWNYFTEQYASIGDSDLSLPNSMAQWFHVDANEYPDGFNLTAIRVWSNNGDIPTVRVYKGQNGLTTSNLVAEIIPDYFYSDMEIRLDEQQYFAPGESFWVAVHFPVQERAYPLGLATTDSSIYPSYCYMSNDMGKTWSLLSDALKGSPYEDISSKAVWAMTAISRNPDWSRIMTISPAEGIVKYNETQEVTVSNDGQPLVNGTYKFNLRFKTNESDGNTTVIPVTMTVKGNKPVMSPAKVVNFGSLLVGESKTFTVEVYNEGYGAFGYYGSLSGDKISCNSEHFEAPSYVSGGFPARSSNRFDVTFKPQSAGSHTGTVTFTHSDDTTEFKVTLTGTATDPAKIVIEPDTIACDTLDILAETISKEFVIKNEGNYPLEYLFPKFSDRQLESQGKAAHKFGYTVISNLDGAIGFAYDGNPALIGSTDITSLFNDNTYLSGAIDLGFAFPYYGKNYERIYISSYGGLAFALGEYNYYPPLTESSERLTGIPYISAYGYQFALNADSRIEYAKQDGKFVISYKNVLALVYDQEYMPISFRIMLSSNGDVEIFYDSYDAMSLFQSGSTLFCGLKDENGEDPMVVTSADIADYWGNNDDPAGDVYMQFASESAVKFVAPKASFITSLTPAYGIVNPGESTTVTATVKANGNMIAGETFNNLVVMSNDPENSTVYVRFDAIITGESLKPVAALASSEIDFGKVFRTSEAQLPVTVKNEGKDSLVVERVALASNAVSIADIAPVTIAAGMSKDIIVTLPTEREGEVTDVMTITTDAGVLTANIAGEVIGCPVAELSYTEITDTVASGTEMKKPLTISNSGNETLVYSIKPNPAYISFTEDTEDAKVSYAYTASIDDSSIKYEWVDIESPGLGEHNNFTYYNTHDYVAVELPFEFPYYGKKYSKMYIYNTGFVSFTERDDQKIWPEPPVDFPGGTIYTNVIAPYWGLHTMDTSKTGGTYHYVTEEEAVVSWMEYGNSMNMGVCFQLIMKKDGSFKFQYKSYGDYAIIYSIFGLAGISDESGREGLRIPERYVAFNNAVQFFPVVEASVVAGESKTVDINVLTDKMAGEYISNVTVNTNVPGSETIEIPISLIVTGEAKPVFPTDSIIVERVVGHFDDANAGPVTQMGANYEACFYVKNEGTAPFTITHIKNGGPSIYDDWFGMYYPIFMTYYEAEETDWMTGEPTGNYIWTQYYDYTPITVAEKAAGVSIPMMYEYANQVGTYDVPLTFYYNENDSAMVNVRFIVTPAPAVSTDKSEVRVENVASDYVGTDSVAISNVGEYKLTYELRLDPIGVGEDTSGSDMGGGGIAPAIAKELSADAVTLLHGNIRERINAFDVTSEKLTAFNTPADFDFNRTLYYASTTGNTSYTYGTGNTYGVYKAATYYEAPADGFNISHVYFATTLTNQDGSKLINADYTVEIIAGDDCENGTVIGKGSFHIDELSGAQFIVASLDKSVYLSANQGFYVVVTYPVGIDFPAYLCEKAENVVSNRYMGYVEGYGWFDIASMFKDTYGSLGYIMSCLETGEGSSWVRVLNPEAEMSGTIEPGQSLNVKFEFNAAAAPLDKGNKAVLVIKSNDPTQPTVNFPIYLDKNAAPEIVVPGGVIYAMEGAATQVEFTVTEPEHDNYTINVFDSGNFAHINSAATVDGSEAKIKLEENNVVHVNDARASVKGVIDITPDYDSAGEYTITVTAADSAAHEAQAVIRYVVVHVNRAPMSANTVETVKVIKGGTSNVIDLDDYFTDPDGDELMYNIALSETGIATVFTSTTNVIFAGEEVGTVTATVTAMDANGASAVQTFIVEVTENSGIENVSIGADVDVYPNPVAETLHVACDIDSKDVTYSIYGGNGALVYSETSPAMRGGVKRIDVSGLTAGIYVLKVTADGCMATYPIVKN